MSEIKNVKYALCAGLMVIAVAIIGQPAYAMQPQTPAGTIQPEHDDKLQAKCPVITDSNIVPDIFTDYQGESVYFSW